MYAEIFDIIDESNATAKALDGNPAALAWIAQAAAKLGVSAEAQAAADALTTQAAGEFVDVEAAHTALKDAMNAGRRGRTPVEPKRAEKAIWFASHPFLAGKTREALYAWLDAVADAAEGERFESFGSPTWIDSFGGAHFYANGSRPASRAAALTEERRDEVKAVALKALKSAFSV